AGVAPGAMGGGREAAGRTHPGPVVGDQQRAVPAVDRDPGDGHALEWTDDGARQAIQADARGDPEIAVEADLEAEDRLIHRMRELLAERGRAARAIDVEKLWRSTAEDHTALQRKHEAAHHVAFAAGQALPAAGDHPREAAAGSGP